MARVRAYRSAAAGALSTAKARAYRSSAAGTAVVGPRVRVFRSRADGPSALTLNPIPSVTGAEPTALLTVTATPASGSATPTSYSWRRVSGTPITVSGTTASITVLTPAGMDGATTVLGVRGVIGSAQSPEQQVTISTLPQIHWIAGDAGWTPVQAKVVIGEQPTNPADRIGLGRSPLGKTLGA